MSSALPIFVLGDSRTGTMSFHRYFLANGLRSIHYFMRESSQTEPLHLHESDNRQHFLDFVKLGQFDAYTDYPTRFFYRALFDEYPESSFILTTRETTDRWERSLRGYLSKFSIGADYAALRNVHEAVNAEIRDLFSSRRHFMEVCIDDDSLENSQRVSDFLGLSPDILLAHDNSIAELDVDVLSKRHQLYSRRATVEDTIVAMELVVAPTKALISESGWTFLVNDPSNFLRVQFGIESWGPAERVRAVSTMHARTQHLGELGAIYRKFIIPEKSIVFRSYLPRALEGIEQSEVRPAQLLTEDCSSFVAYLANYMIDACSYGQLYFRGDTHTNWLGAWFVYRFIADRLAREGLVAGEQIALGELDASIASYEGDLSVQVPPSLRREFDARWGFTTSRAGFDLTTKLVLSKARRVAHQIEVPETYGKWVPGRETLVYERPDGDGLRAVVFRDSTLDFCYDLIAQHFSRCVFIWRDGQVYEDVIQLERPDVVIHVMAERFVVRYDTFEPVVSI